MDHIGVSGRVHKRLCLHQEAPLIVHAFKGCHCPLLRANACDPCVEKAGDAGLFQHIVHGALQILRMKIDIFISRGRDNIVPGAFAESLHLFQDQLSRSFHDPNRVSAAGEKSAEGGHAGMGGLASKVRISLNKQCLCSCHGSSGSGSNSCRPAACHDYIILIFPFHVNFSSHTTDILLSPMQ